MYHHSIRKFKVLYKFPYKNVPSSRTIKNRTKKIICNTIFIITLHKIKLLCLFSMNLLLYGEYNTSFIYSRVSRWKKNLEEIKRRGKNRCYWEK